VTTKIKAANANRKAEKRLGLLGIGFVQICLVLLLHALRSVQVASAYYTFQTTTMAPMITTNNNKVTMTPSKALTTNKTTARRHHRAAASAVSVLLLIMFFVVGFHHVPLKSSHLQFHHVYLNSTHSAHKTWFDMRA